MQYCVVRYICCVPYHQDRPIDSVINLGHLDETTTKHYESWTELTILCAL